MVGKEVILDEKGNTKSKVIAGIYLESRIFQSWLQAKFDAGYESCSDSDFTAQLLIVEGKLIYILRTIYFTCISICVLLQDTGKYGKKV